MKNIKLREERKKLAGQKIRGLVLTELNYELNVPVYTYICSVCNNIGKVSYYALHKKTTDSCRKCAQKINARKKWTGEGDISGEFLSSMMSDIKRRKREYNITKEYLWKLFLEQNKICPLSGIQLSFSSAPHIRDGNASLDRIDNNKGYIEGNVRWVDKNINMIRRKLDDNDFIWFCKQVANTHKNKKIKRPDTRRFIT